MKIKTTVTNQGYLNLLTHNPQDSPWDYCLHLHEYLRASQFLDS